MSLGEFPSIGNYLEIEGDCAAILEAAKLLGLSEEAAINQNYGAIFKEWKMAHPQNKAVNVLWEGEDHFLHRI